uniref:Uncharacterized protein n=1 Tax=Panagrolaimus sp. ES5 TaxID=591445 RepID=A0AC34FNI6_9BILA
MVDSEEDESCSHYQINLQQFKQTIREKANFGFRSLGRMSYINRRSIQFIDELPTSREEEDRGNYLDYSQTFRPSKGSLSPPNTPTSSESSSSSVTSSAQQQQQNHGSNNNDPQKLLTETIRKQAQKPSGGDGAEYNHVIVHDNLKPLTIAC